ncbi:hypothetical protein [Halorussus litoreus]|uniref:hypothetical protein n=1 Tax=Halorussus litoreus TaxID=1710536 RepID=UPI000E2422EE|nr:hypothetical protein [Halorussus litoreus]
MARDETARERDPERSLLDRRSYLRLAGAAAASVAVAGASGSADAAGQETTYETITVPAGETRSFEVESGETLENLHLDMTADGASARISASGDDWTVRNVAFEGEHPGGHYLLDPAVSSEDAEGLVENVYMGDGQTEGSDEGAIWVHGSDHYGTITFRNLNVRHFVDNGLYGTGPGASVSDSHGGVVHVEDSYFESNNVANIRVGSIDGRTCRVDNCVVKTGSARALDDGAVNSRGVWAWWGPVDVRDSDIEGGYAEHTERAGNPSVSATNTRWDDEADTDRIPAGVPATPEDAVSSQ